MEQDVIGQILGIALSCIVSAGGVGGITYLVIKLASDSIAEALSKKYELKLNEELEQYKSHLAHKAYITKTKFDAEFEIYRELSKSFFEAVKEIAILVPYGLATFPADKEDREKYEKETYNQANDAVALAQNVLSSNAPFIPKEFYEAYSDILSDCSIQLTVFAERWNVAFIGHKFGESTLEREDYQRTKDLTRKFNELNCKIRTYIESLDVIE